MNKICKMKKWTLGLFLLCGGQALAQSSKESATLQVWMDDITVTADGETITYLTVYEHDDAATYTAFNMTLNVPKGLHIANVKAGRDTRNAIDLSVRATATHSISCNMPNDTQVKIICTSSQNQTFYPDDEEGTPVDELFTIGFVADTSLKGDTYTVTTEGVDFVLVPGAADVAAYTPMVAPSFQLTVDDGGVGLDGVGANSLGQGSQSAATDRFDLSGRRVQQTTPAGVYIQDRKKVLVK